MWSRALAVLLVAALATLSPLASASPSDPLWLGGVFDAADGDEVVAAASIEAAGAGPIIGPTWTLPAAPDAIRASGSAGLAHRFISAPPGRAPPRS